MENNCNKDKYKDNESLLNIINNREKDKNNNEDNKKKRKIQKRIKFFCKK